MDKSPLLQDLRDLARDFTEREIRDFFLSWIERIDTATSWEDVPDYSVNEDIFVGYEPCFGEGFADYYEGRRAEEIASLNTMWRK